MHVQWILGKTCSVPLNILSIVFYSFELCLDKTNTMRVGRAHPDQSPYFLDT